LNPPSILIQALQSFTLAPLYADVGHTGCYAPQAIDEIGTLSATIADQRR
jgi:hypothetical protein